MKAKEVFVLILIVAAGVIFYHVHTGKFSLDWDWGDSFFWGTEEFFFEEFETIEPPFPSSLKVINAHGDVEIQGTDDERITFTFQKRIWRKDEEQAKEVSERLLPVVTKESGRVVVSTTREEFKKRNFETNFRMTVPLGLAVDVTSSYGLVSVKDVGDSTLASRHGRIRASLIRGNLSIQNSYEDVEIENVQGNCSVDSKHAKLFANTVGGEMSILHRHGKIHLENIAQEVDIKAPHTEIFCQELEGPAKIENSYERITLFRVGPVKITGHHSPLEAEGVRGNVEINNNYSRVKLTDIQGNLHVTGKSLDVYGKSVSGEDISISSSYQNIELSRFSGKTVIYLSHGDVVLDPLPLTFSVEVKGEYTNITFYWPQGGEYPFDARAKNGEIKWKIPASLLFEEKNGLTVAKAYVDRKDKPSVSLATSYGNIRVEETIPK